MNVFKMWLCRMAHWWLVLMGVVSTQINPPVISHFWC